MAHVLNECEQDNILMAQKDDLLSQIDELTEMNWLECHFRARMIIAQIGIVRRLWIESDYKYKLREVCKRLSDFLNKKTQEHEDRRANAKLAECLLLQQKLDSLTA